MDFFIAEDAWQHTYQKGWHDYFTSLKDWDPKVQYASIHNYRHTDVPNRDQLFTVQQYLDAIQDVFQMTEELQTKAKEFQATIGGPYTSLYVRRGDKVANSTKEMELIPLETILKTCSIQDDGRRLFIMTDDYGVVEEARKLLPKSTVTTLCPKTVRGSYTEENRGKSPEEKKAHTEELLMSCLIFKGGETQWADDRSNVGRFLYLYGYPICKTYPEQKTASKEKLILPSALEWVRS